MKSQRVTRKYQAINPIDVFVKYGDFQSFVKGWNSFLTQCLHKRDVNKLVQTLGGLQTGMMDLSKQKLNIPRVNKLFLRMDKSIRDTIKKIVKKRSPHTTELEIDKFIRDHSA